jgi:hypothetical protein
MWCGLYACCHAPASSKIATCGRFRARRLRWEAQALLSGRGDARDALVMEDCFTASQGEHGGTSRGSREGRELWLPIRRASQSSRRPLAGGARFPYLKRLR